MLHIKNISKKYVTGELVQNALSDVSLSLRDNEFVAILGPSGSGKTTLLNIVGGLDRYDSGDLVINGISTKRYKDKDWDSYRNHTIGFVFQSYNLIPHQSVLSNVELALTISGVSKAERRQRAKEALEKVGLAEHIHKRPNQLSGGQMQRVAIARALVNNPDILLADEPTGALDSETSVQVMNMLAEVAKDRLVIMVTHNPELAEQYATRIVKLRDGKIISDSNPVTEEDDGKEQPAEHKNMGKTSMSFLTSLSLSFNNLKTKKGRTILTSFAGSIGIIGIALIMSLSNGVNNYIMDVQRDAMASYPITIDAQSMDLSSIIESTTSLDSSNQEAQHEKDAVYSNNKALTAMSDVTSSITENNLTKFKTFLDKPDNEIQKSVGSNGIVYSYDTKFSVYNHDPENKLVNINKDPVIDEEQMQSLSPMSNFTKVNSSVRVSGNMSQLMPGSDGKQISPAIEKNYEVLYGRYPENYDELILVINKDNEISASILYEMGLMPVSEYKEFFEKMNKGEKIEPTDAKWSYEDICKTEFSLLPACDMYIKNSHGTYSLAKSDPEIENLLKNAITLKITGVIRLKEDSDSKLIRTNLGYTRALTDYLIKHTDESEIVRTQRENPDKNILTGMRFAPESDAQKIADVKSHFSSMGISEKADLIRTTMSAISSDAASQLDKMGETELAMQFDAYLMTADDKLLLQMYDMYVSPGSYDDNMAAFGVVSVDAPSSIAIYVDTFEAKDKISACIEEYNEAAEESDKIVYTDYIGLLMSSVTTIITMISYILIAFVAVSLVVSSIMIGIITYISVLERTKEIGILRAIGASKKNISQVFNAETFIIGLFSGIMGVGLSLLLLLPSNIIIHAVAGNSDLVASLPPIGGAALILLSMVLTLIGGIIPAGKAAKQDPVKALRTE